MRRILSVLLLTGIALATQAVSTETIGQLLLRLDRTVKLNDSITLALDREAERCKANMRVALTPTDLFLSTEQVAEAYAYTNSDSALFYYDRLYAIGRENNNQAWMTQASVHRAFIHVECGDNLVAHSILGAIDGIDHLHPILQAEYAKAVMNNYANFPNTMGGSRSESADSLWNLYSKYIPHDTPDYWVMHHVTHQWNYNAAEAVEPLQMILRKFTKASVERAKTHMQLFIVYTEMNEKDLALRHGILAAIDNIQCGVKRTTAMLRLVQYLYDNFPEYATPKRMQNYMNVCIENVSRFRGTAFSLRLVKLQKRMLENSDVLARQQQKIRAVTQTMLAVSAAIILWLAVRVRRMKRKQKELGEELDRRGENAEKQSRQLRSQLETLEEKLAAMERNDVENCAQTKEANRLMIEVYVQMASIIKEVKLQKREMSNLIAAGQNKDARKLANAAMVKDASQELFYALFDHHFLLAYPGFCQHLNSLLRPDAQIEQPSPTTLAPEQRICAFISLGVTDSRTLADILQYSVQTVYNYRMKTRHRCIEPGIALDNFLQKGG